MPAAHVTLAADSIPLPDEFRRHVRWEPGDALVIESDGDSLLGQADRACLGLGLARGVPVVPADRAWAGLDLGVTIELIR